MVDSIVIGSGCAGSVVARKLAESGKKVLILEKRSHIAGNCFDRKEEHGILIHQYGPHIFHTNKKNVYDFLSRFTEWTSYQHEVVANIHGEYIPVPFNLNSLELVFGEKSKTLQDKLIKKYGEGSRVPILKLKEDEDKEIVAIAEYVYQNVFLKYTMKQWGQKPEEIDPAVTARVPVLISRDNRYFQDVYQGMPKEGYTVLFQKMLDHENIHVELETDAKKVLQFLKDGIYYKGEKIKGPVIFTGAVDELFDCKYGRLPYRTLEFEFEYYNQQSYQPKAVVNYTVDQDYTRITEYKKLTKQKCNGTVIMKEYPKSYSNENEIPYYAITNEKNNALYEKYRCELKKYNNLYLLGRLAEYKYYNIDAIVDRALELAVKI